MAPQRRPAPFCVLTNQKPDAPRPTPAVQPGALASRPRPGAPVPSAAPRRGTRTLGLGARSWRDFFLWVVCLYVWCVNAIVCLCVLLLEGVALCWWSPSYWRFGMAARQLVRGGFGAVLALFPASRDPHHGHESKSNYPPHQLSWNLTGGAF